MFAQVKAEIRPFAPNIVGISRFAGSFLKFIPNLSY